MLRPRYLIPLLIVAALIAGYVFREPLLRRAGEWLDVGQPPTKADYVLVLGGEEATRPFVGAAIVRAGVASKGFLVRIAASPLAEDAILPPRHEIARAVLLRRGVAADQIELLDGAAISTFDEAVSLRDRLADEPDARVLVVTTHFHTRRSRWIMRQVLGPKADRLTMVSAPADRFELDRWWENRDGLLAVTSEYLKLLFYAYRYGKAIYWTLGVIAAIVLFVAYRRWRRRVHASRASPTAA